MPTRRILKYCLALSVLFHLALGTAALMIPWAPRPAQDVVVVEMADIPRAADFLPPKPGIVEGARPKPPPLSDRPVRKEMPPEFRRLVPAGRAPDRPADPGLPPETVVPERQANEEPQPARPAESPARTARAAEPPQEARPTPPSKDGAAPAAKGGAGRSLRDLTPSLGKTVTARRDAGTGRGQGSARGSAAGTDAKARDKGGIAEEGGREASFNGPEFQYYAYFESIRQKIYLVWNYPEEAWRAGKQGDVEITFVIGPEGELVSYNVLRGSGHKILDDEAVRALLAIGRFNKPPIPNFRVYGVFRYGVYDIKFFR